VTAALVVAAISAINALLGSIRFQIMLTSDYWDCDAMLGGDAMRYAIIVPAGVNTDQVLDVLVNNLRNHPEKRHEASRVLIAWALQKAFPCR
jgi:hypothetical protein